MVAKGEWLHYIDAGMANHYQIGAYYFPNYHADPRNEALYGKGWTEWELMKRAQPRFPNHPQPKVPAWGYEDESDPAVFARKIDAAADHGLTQFIFDWYWHEEGMFLNRGLDEGYLRAANRDRLQFSLMWANHDWVDIFPQKRSQRDAPKLLYRGAVSPQTFDRLTDHIVEHYFSAPAYWKIDGKPYFSIYELYRLVESFGSVEDTHKALQRFRAKVKSAGHPDLHLNAVVWGIQLLPGERSVSHPREMLHALGFDSTTTYAWIHHVRFDKFPFTPYETVMEKSAAYWHMPEGEFGLPYFPNVSMGWDSTPRTTQSDVHDEGAYPFTALLEGNTPVAFRSALEKVKAFLDARNENIFNINAWNEWTEGSYLEPDTVNGMAYLEAIRDTFNK
jgi:hypothetical protein